MSVIKIKVNEKVGIAVVDDFDVMWKGIIS